jgi:uncharacterized phage infection (PIP) family protein YhgE
MTQSTTSPPATPHLRRNDAGFLEFFVPQLGEYVIAMVPVQSRGGLVTRLAASQFAKLQELLGGIEGLDALGGLAEAINQYDGVLTKLQELSITAGQNLDAITPDMEAAREALESINEVFPDFRQTIETRLLDVSNKTVDYTTRFLDVINAITLNRADTIGAIAANKADITAAINASSTAITNTVNLLSARVDATNQKLDAANQRLDTLNQTLTNTRANTLDQTDVVMANANQEYFYVIPNNTKVLTFRVEPVAGATADDPPTAADAFYSLQTGQVALASAGQLTTGGTRPKCRRVLALNEFHQDSIDLTGKVLYFSCAQAGWVMAIDTWYRA